MSDPSTSSGQGPPKALVTGATGFTGRHMVKFLLENGYQILATDLKKSDDPLFADPRVDFIPVDLTKFSQADDGEFIEKACLADAVFHIAGLFNHSASLSKLYEVNVQGTKNLLRALGRSRFKKPRVIVWGAAGVFGEFDHIPLPATEEMPPKTDNPYFFSKLIQEREALEMGRCYNLPVTVIRPSAIYGSHSNYGMAISIKSLLKSKLAFVIGNGKNKCGLVHVEDLARAAEFLARNEKAIGEVYHVTDDSLYCLEDITRHLAKCCGAVFLPIKIPRWLALKFSKLAKIDRELIHITAVNTWISNEKIKKLGFEFQYADSLEGLSEVAEWYKKEAKK